MAVYYFGCKSQDEIGHYPYTPGMRRYPFTLLLTQCRRRSEQFASYGGNDYTDAACQMDEIAKALEGT